MKALLFLLLFPLSLMGQEFELNSDCGTWVKDTVTLSDWETIDTINYDPNASADWVYAEWDRETSNWITLVYCPCGCGDPDYRTRKRINLQGIRQKQTEKTSYRYVPKLLSDYDKIMEKINERTPKDTMSLASSGTTLTVSLHSDTLTGLLRKQEFNTLLLSDPVFCSSQDKKIDTVEVWMNCAEMDDRGLPSYNITMKGWEVRTPKWVPAYWDENDAYIWGHWEIEKSYLNHFKHPLTGYIVWQTKEIK